MRAIVSEGIGTALLVAAVVGSGIMGERLSGIEPAGIPGFIVAQLAGALAATLLFRWIANGNGERASR